MKKFLLSLVTILFVFSILINVDATEKKTKATKKSEVACANKIDIHLFWGDGCPHCEGAINFFESMEEEYGHCFNLEKHEVWKDKDNRKLMENVGNYFGKEVSGVPFIVIGEETFSGYSSKLNEDILSAIKTAANDEEYVDVVEKVIAGEVNVQKSSSGDTIVTILIILVIVGGIGALVATSKSK